MTDDGRMIRNGVDVLGLMGYFQNTESKPTALNYLLSLFVNRTSNLTENMFNITQKYEKNNSTIP